MPDTLRPAFEDKIILLDVGDIVVSKDIAPHILKKSKKFAAIVASIKEYGSIEPLMVFPTQDGFYLLVDGHLKLEAFKKLGVRTVECLIATDDECFTYNRHVSRIANIQEHKMIANAIKRGVSAAKLAKALDIDILSLQQKKNLLNGICPEAAEPLKDKVVSGSVFGFLKRMKYPRQVEAVGLMVESDNYTRKFIQAIYAATPENMLSEPRKRTQTAHAPNMSRLEEELVRAQGDFRAVEETHGENMMDLTLARKFVKLLLRNEKIDRYVQTNAPDIYQGLKSSITNYGTTFDSIEE